MDSNYPTSEENDGNLTELSEIKRELNEVINICIEESERGYSFINYLELVSYIDQQIQEENEQQDINNEDTERDENIMDIIEIIDEVNDQEDYNNEEVRRDENVMGVI